MASKKSRRANGRFAQPFRALPCDNLGDVDPAPPRDRTWDVARRDPRDGSWACFTTYERREDARRLARALNALAPRAGLGFVDPATLIPFRDDERCDARGVDLVGVEDDPDSAGSLLWWGTDRAAWILSPHVLVWVVEGPSGAHRRSFVLMGTHDEAVDYAERHGARVDYVEQLGRVGREADGFDQF